MIATLVVAVFFTMGSRVIFSPLMPTLQRELDITLSAAGFMFLLISVSYGTAMLLAGFLSSRIGHGHAIVVALATIAAGLLVAASAPSAWVLGVGVVMIGSGAGIYPPSGLVMINTAISEQRRGTAFSLHEIGPNLALLAAPLVVLALEPLMGWRGVLVTMAVLTALAGLVFRRWGTADSGRGVAPDFGTTATILKMRTTLLAVVVLSAGLAGVQGVYAILPAYLVSEQGLPSDRVNLLLSLSRVAGILLLLRGGPIMHRFGRRRTLVGVLLFSALCTLLLGVLQGPLLLVLVVVQPALLSVLFPAVLASVAEIGERRYQNLTYAFVITLAVAVGAGAAPALLGVLADLGVGWAGFFVLAAHMVAATVFLRATPEFGAS